MDVFKSVEEWAKQNKWVELDILRQKLDYVDNFYIKSNIAKKYHLPEGELKDIIEKVLSTIEDVSYEEKELLLDKINLLLAEKEIKALKKQILHLSDPEKNAIYMLSKMNLEPRTSGYIPWNNLYKASYGIDAPFDVEDKLIELGYMYYDFHDARKNKYPIYHIPSYILEFLKDIDSYVESPISIDVKKIVEKIKEEDVDQIIFLYGYIKGFHSWPCLNEVILKRYLTDIKPGLYAGDGSSLYFSPLYEDEFKNIITTEINNMVKDNVEILKDIIERAYRDKAIVQKVMPYYNSEWDGWGTIITDGLEAMGVLVVPTLMWDRSIFSYDRRSPHVSFIKSQRYSLIINSRPIIAQLLKDIYLEEAKHRLREVNMIILSTYDNAYYIKGRKPRVFDVFLKYAEELGFKFKDITKEVMDKIFPFDYEHIAGFIHYKYKNDELYSFAEKEYGIIFGTSPYVPKHKRIKILMENVKLSTIAKDVGYPNVPSEVSEKIPIQETPYTKVDTEKRDVSPSIDTLDRHPSKPFVTSGEIIIGNDKMPPQWGIIGKTKDSKVVKLDLNAPHIVFVSGMMGAGKGYTIGVISEMLASHSIKNISTVPKKATIIVLYKPRDDVPSEFWSIRYKNDVKEEVEKLKAYYNIVPLEIIGKEGFKVFVDPTVHRNYEDKFSSEYETNNVYPLYIDPSTLISEDWANTLAAGGSNDALYIKKIFKILRELPPNFDLDTVRKSVDKSNLTEGQKGFARARLEILEEYLKKDDFMKKLAIGGVNIFDFRKAMYTPDDIFTIMTLIISRLQNKKEFEKEPFVFIINEAHMYFKKGLSKEFIDTIENLIRRKRHGANWLLLDTHLPDDVDQNIIRLSDIKILHFSDKTVESPILKRIVEGTPVKLHELSTGECIVSANISSEGLSKPIFVRIRPRITKHGGATKTSVRVD